MRRRLLVLAVVLAALVGAGAAQAHPLGNFTVNSSTEVVVTGDRLYALAALDLAEIPTFQARDRVRELGRRGYRDALARSVVRGLRVEVAGDRRTPTILTSRLRFRPGAAGLETTRLELVLDLGKLTGPSRLGIGNDAFEGRLGWREIVVRGDAGAAVVASSVPSTSPSARLARYPAASLQSPLAIVTASARVSPGGGKPTVPSFAGPTESDPNRAADGGFAALVAERDLTAGFLLTAIVVALFWGAAHALTPGHGKSIVAAYLVGTRGRARDAFALGGIVTVTHTIGVFTFGLVTLALSEFIVPEDLYPWINLAAALMVVGVGVTVLRARLRGRAGRTPHPHDHGHQHPHTHGHHGHGDHHHGDHHHEHVPAPGTGARGLLAVGISGGLLPCPTALVVLLAAISLNRVALGLVLIVAFSLGLASVVTAIGLVAVGARSTFGRLGLDGGVVRALPALSAVLVLVIGLAMTVRALPAVV